MFQSTAARTILKYSKHLTGGAIVTSFISATYYRPLPDRSHEKDNDMVIKMNNKMILDDDDDDDDKKSLILNGPNRKHEFLCSHEKPIFSREETPIFLQIAQHITISITTLAIRLFMNTYGEYDIMDNQQYKHFLELVLGGHKRKENKQGLITISNHRSLFDDPGVVSCLLPLWIGIQPKYNRWGICAQEYCYTDKLPSIVKGYIGAGQVLPIRRGAGIDQALFRDFASLIAHGEWCHIFPEGGIWQSNELGGRGRGHTADVILKAKKSKLKWGIGKLIAHAPVRPRVVPFAHVGMETLLPKDPVDGISKLKEKIIGGDPLKVHICFGEGKSSILFV